MKIKILAALSIAALLSACGGEAQQKQEKPQEVSAEVTGSASGTGENTKARQAAFDEMADKWKPLADMVKGETAYDAAAFAAGADAFAKLAPTPFEHFQQDGEGLNGDAKSEIWTNAAGFKAEEDKFLAAVKKFNATAATAKSIDVVKADFGAVGASCGSCHNAFREQR